MSEILVKKVSTNKELNAFINFPFQLYKGNAFWVPPLKFDERNTLRKDKNPAFEYCEAEYWLAYRDKRVVGRIAGIINHKEHERWNTKLVRFGWIDFVDDPEVSRNLIETASVWGRDKGMTGLHGPLGFTDMDPEGMLFEGFDQISSLSAIYNFPYYNDHMELLGFRKATDWVQFEINIPAEIPEKVERMSRIVMQKYNLRLLKPQKAKEIIPYAAKMFTMYNEAFHDIYGFSALTEKQMDYYTKQYFGFIRPEFVSMIIDSKDDVVGFGITMPSLSLALQKADGSLFPFGFLHLWRAMRKNDTIHMYLIGVRPDYQGKGVLALIYHELNVTCIKTGFKLARTHPQLEENFKAISIWKNYDSRINIRRRCWIR
ncbi:MAG: GNAT family N-acetyltransferase [Bacteroidales bacterium]|nr:GNAT family N-acetyltransferase [Bacteroidales bacterium]